MALDLESLAYAFLSTVGYKYLAKVDESALLETITKFVGEKCCFCTGWCPSEGVFGLILPRMQSRGDCAALRAHSASGCKNVEINPLFDRKAKGLAISLLPYVIARAKAESESWNENTAIIAAARKLFADHALPTSISGMASPVWISIGDDLVHFRSLDYVCVVEKIDGVWIARKFGASEKCYV